MKLRLHHSLLHHSLVAALALSLALALLPLADVASAQNAASRNARTVGERGRRQTTALAADRRTDSTAAARPRLVLLIAIDQFRYDYLERFGDLFVAGGLRRLQQAGGSWAQAHYDHVPTETAPGHATMLTGAYPSGTGIVGNDWYDREARAEVSNATDNSVRLLGGEPDEEAASPRKLLASTLGDELRLATNNRAKVIGISVKDRGAILPAGRHASAAYWYSTRTGRMVSSTYYFNELPAWVARFNAARPADRFFNARWERLLPEAEYVRRAGPDAPPWENFGAARGAHTFPHTINGGASAPGREFYSALRYSPFTSEILVDFAKQAIINEALGADADTDVLTVSFSANDSVGHRFGPYSQETMDAALRVDRQIAALLDFVDARIGLRHTLVAFTADHGVGLVPEHARAMNLPGARIRSEDVEAAARQAIRAHYARSGEAGDRAADYVLAFSNEHLYFDLRALARDGVRLEEIERVAVEALMNIQGVARCFTRTQLESGATAPSDAMARRVLHGFHPRRSGDVVVIYEPFVYSTDSAASHGSPYTYDTHVPLIIMGGGVRAGRYQQAASPADIAPTLAAILRLQPPSNAVGRVLIEALSADGGR